MTFIDIILVIIVIIIAAATTTQINVLQAIQTPIVRAIIITLNTTSPQVTSLTQSV